MSQTSQPPANLLFSFIIAFLTPMFLSAADGNLPMARLAAAETLRASRAETHTGLITVAKIIAFGLATLGSLSLSMADDLSIAKILRLRASANATDRAEHRNRLLLDRAHRNTEPEIDHAALTAAVAQTQQRTAENLAKLTPSAPIPPTRTVTGVEQHDQATWAACTAAIAAETAAYLPSLPPAERESAALWVEVLNSAANSFLTDGIPPQTRRPRRHHERSLITGRGVQYSRQ